MCDQQLYTQCETTQVREQGSGAALFGYSKLYGEVPGGQAEYLRVPQAQFTHIKVPDGPSDERFVYLSDVLPTAWQAVAVRRRSPTAARSSCSVSARSATWRPASPRTRARGSSASTWCPSGWPERAARGIETIDLPSTRTTSAT